MVDSETLNMIYFIYYLLGVELTEFLTGFSLALMFYDQGKIYLRKEIIEEDTNRGRNLSELLSTNVASRKVTYKPFRMTSGG